MNLRATIQRHPRVTAGVGIALLATIGLVIASNVATPSKASEASLFFTTDDGKTWFRGSAKNVPPFEHDGKTAYQVFLWTNDNGKTQLVSHLFRYTAAGRQRILEQQKNGTTAANDVVTAMADAEVKRPGQPESAWVRITDPRARGIVARHGTRRECFSIRFIHDSGCRCLLSRCLGTLVSTFFGLNIA